MELKCTIHSTSSPFSPIFMTSVGSDTAPTHGPNQLSRWTHVSGTDYPKSYNEPSSSHDIWAWWLLVWKGPEGKLLIARKKESGCNYQTMMLMPNHAEWDSMNSSYESIVGVRSLSSLYNFYVQYESKISCDWRSNRQTCTRERRWKILCSSANHLRPWTKREYCHSSILLRWWLSL